MRNNSRSTLIVLVMFWCLANHARAVETSDRFIINVNGSYGFIDGRGNVMIPPRYLAVHEFSEGLAAIDQDGKWGYVNANGDEVVAPIYENASDFSEGVGVVIDKAGHLSYFDHKGQPTMLDCVTYPSDDISLFQFSEHFSEGLLPVRLSGETDYIDRTCKKVIVQNGYAADFSEGLAVVSSQEGRVGYIDQSGRAVIPYMFQAARNFSEGLALAEKEGKWGYIDTSGKFVIPPQFGQDSRNFHEGLAAVQIGHRMGYIDEWGKIVVPARFNEAWDFSEGVAQVQTPRRRVNRGGRMENAGGLDLIFIDHTGRKYIRSSFIPFFGDGFSGGRAQVMSHGKLVYIDRDGRVIWPK